MISGEIKICPHKESSAGIGWFFHSIDLLKGEFIAGIFFGKYLFHYSPNKKWEFLKSFGKRRKK